MGFEEKHFVSGKWRGRRWPFGLFGMQRKRTRRWEEGLSDGLSRGGSISTKGIRKRKTAVSGIGVGSMERKEVRLIRVKGSCVGDAECHQLQFCTSVCSSVCASNWRGELFFIRFENDDDSYDIRKSRLFLIGYSALLAPRSMIYE